MPNRSDHDGMIELKEILGRVDERVKHLVESHIHLTSQFDRLLEFHNRLSDRVTHLEAISNSVQVDEVQTQYHKLSNRMVSVEGNTSSIIKLEIDFKELEKRIIKLESGIEDHKSTMVRWSGLAMKIGELIFKVTWIIGMAYILYHFGLGGVNFPP